MMKTVLWKLEEAVGYVPFIEGLLLFLWLSQND